MDEGYLLRISRATKEFLADAAYGGVKIIGEFATAPWIIPTAIRKVANRDTILQNAHREEKGYGFGNLIGFGVGLAPGAFVALAEIPTAIIANHYGHYLPAKVMVGAISLTQGASLIYEGLRWARSSPIKSVGLEAITEKME